MNARERFLDTLAFAPTDRGVSFELGMWAQTLDRWYEEGLPPDVHAGAEPSSHANLNAGNEYFHLDRVGYLPLRPVSMIPAFTEEILEEDERYFVKRYSDGHVARALKEGMSHTTRASMDQYLSWAVTDRASWEQVKKRFDPRSPLRYPPWWSDLARCLRGRDYPLNLTPDGGFGLYSFLRRLMGTERACTIFYDDPALAEDMLDFMATYFIEFSRRAAEEVEVDCVNFWEDFAFNTGPLIGPNIFRAFLLPRYRRINDFWRSHGVRHFSVDSDGNPEVLIPLMIEAGITLLWPLERAAGVDPLKLRQEYGRDLALLGGVDKRALAAGPRAIDEELHRFVPRLLEDGGYIPCVDHWIPPDVSYGNFLYYLESKRKLLGVAEAVPGYPPVAHGAAARTGG